VKGLSIFHFITQYFILVSGVLIQNVDDNTYEIFAPNKDAMDEAMLMIDDILESKVCLVFPSLHNSLV
jgi:hypothetical protein